MSPFEKVRSAQSSSTTRITYNVSSRDNPRSIADRNAILSPICHPVHPAQVDRPRRFSKIILELPRRFPSLVSLDVHHN